MRAPCGAGRSLLPVAIGLAASAGLMAGCGGVDERVDSELVADSLAQMASRAGWPGFDPTAVPYALFDDERTFLFGHPSPPAGFKRLRGSDEGWYLDSIHPAMRANSTTELGGVLIATVRVDTSHAGRPADVARLLVHETFHVFQTEHHPEWTANEVDLFTYPVFSARTLHMRRLETAALRRGLMAPDSARVVCWARGVRDLRNSRFRRLSDEAVAYERGTELREGLARYVEQRADPERPLPTFPPDGFPPEDVRERGYQSGFALAWLLDRLDPSWKERLASGEHESLDAALAASLTGLPEGRTCDLSPDEVGRARTVARDDSASLREANLAGRRQFEEAAGWRIAVETDRRSPLSPSAFDPLNVRVLGGGWVLHDRWLQLARDDASIELLDRTGLTRAAGRHPLFDGVRVLLVTGLRSEPEMELIGDTLRMEADGFEARFVGAEVEVEDRAIRISLGR